MAWVLPTSRTLPDGRLVALSAVGLLAIRAVGPQYDPLPEPPWERAL